MQGPDTSDKRISLRVFHKPIDPCGDNYKNVPGDIAGFGVIDGKGGGEPVDECGQCAGMCSGLKTCESFECSPTEVCRNHFSFSRMILLDLKS